MSRARRPQRRRRHRGQRPERSGGPGRRQNLGAQRPRGGRLCCRPGKFFRRTGWRRRRRALGLKETCQGWSCGDSDKGPGGASQRHLNPGSTGGARGCWPGLTTKLGCHVFRATGIKASGPMRMSRPVSANKSRACEALRPHRAARSHATRWSGLTGPSALAVSAPGRSALCSPIARRHR